MLETVLYPDELKHRDTSNQHGQYNQIHPKGREQHRISFLHIVKSIIHQVIHSLLYSGYQKETPASCKIMVKFLPNLSLYEGLEGISISALIVCKIHPYL